MSQPSATQEARDWTGFVIKIASVVVLSIVCWVGAFYAWFFAYLTGFRAFFGESGRIEGKFWGYFLGTMLAAVLLALPLLVAGRLFSAARRACWISAAVLFAAVLTWTLYTWYTG